MTITSDQTSAVSRQMRPALLLLAFFVCFALTVLIAGFTAGLRINTTRSEPLGLWRITMLDRPVKLGDIVFVCPPDTKDMHDARSRGYLRSGLCAGGNAPLIKTVAAVAGQIVEIGSAVRVDGKVLRNSRLLSTDGKQRKLQPYRGGRLDAGDIYLHSDFPGSFDSRYFGPLRSENVLGLAQEVLTYVP